MEVKCLEILTGRGGVRQITIHADQL
jgi:hypothetical protein